MLEVDFPPELFTKVPEDRQEALMGVLKNDPRPSYHNDPERVYGFPFGDMEIKFMVKDKILQVVEIEVAHR